MKIFSSAVLFAALVGFTTEVRAAVYSYNFTGGFANAGNVPDGNATGWFDTRTLSGINDSSIADVNVFLNISGGYDGDFYACLTHDSGFSVLLNRVGRTGGDAFGYPDSGLNVVFDDAAVNGDIHLYQTVTGFAASIGNGGSWSPDGRNTNPLLTLDADGRTRLLDQFNGLNPNGGWTLFVADLSNGDQGTVTSWGMSITAVPEPSPVCFGMMGALILLVVRSRFRR